MDPKEAQNIKELILHALHAKEQTSIDFLSMLLKPEYKQDSSYVLDKAAAPERHRHAQRLALCMLVGKPVLIEGPAATGKTSLVSFLAKYRKTQSSSTHVSITESGSSSQHKEEEFRAVERVNNTQSTSAQDYLGSHIPCGQGAEGTSS